MLAGTCNHTRLDFLSPVDYMHAAMKRKWIALLTTALSALPLAGCGTVRNLLSDHPEPYGGLARDAGGLARDADSAGSSVPSAPIFPQGISGGDPRGLLFGLALIVGIGATELCATGLADTLCLPYFYLRDGELFPKDCRSDDTRDFSAMPVQDSWPRTNPPRYSSANCVWQGTYVDYPYSGCDPFRNDHNEAGEKEWHPAAPAMPLDHGPFLSVRDLAAWSDGGQSALSTSLAPSSPPSALSCLPWSLPAIHVAPPTDQAHPLTFSGIDFLPTQPVAHSE
jgi:hypothetical protein